MTEQLPSDQPIHRYDLKGNQSGDAWVGRHADGPFVRYDDHLEFARAQERRIAELERATMLPGEAAMDMRFTRVDIERLEALLK